MIHIHLSHQGCAPQHSMANKGGGGGGSGSPYYANMDALYGQQSRAAGFMLDQSMPRLPGYFQNSQDMVDDAFSGKLAERARNTAGADASQSLGMGLGAANRNMERYGAEFNPTKAGYAARDAGLAGASMRSGAMNTANQWAEDQKWNRNAGAFGQAAGMGTGAMQSLGQSGAGFASAGNAMMQNDSQNAQGMGAFGAAVAKNFANGGEVRLAQGGDAWSAWKNQNPIATSGGMQGGGGSGMGSLATGLGMGLAAKGVGKGLSAAWDAAGMTDKLKQGAADLYGAGRAGIEKAFGATFERAGDMAPVVDKSIQVGAEQLGDKLVEEGAEKVAENSIPGAGSFLSAGRDIAEGDYLKGGAKLALSTVDPTGGAVSNTLIDLIAATGGDVGTLAQRQGLRKDMTGGGKVSGPGTETSDSIPARLSNGEFVLNAEAVKLIGKDKLEALNNQGLAMRSGQAEEAAEGHPNVKDSPAEERREGLKSRKAKAPAKKAGKGLKLAKGGSVKKGC